jgi:hypothetical protein
MASILHTRPPWQDGLHCRRGSGHRARSGQCSAGVGPGAAGPFRDRDSSPTLAGACTPGRIVDFCRDLPIEAHGYLLDKGAIDVPGFAATTAFDINDRGAARSWALRFGGQAMVNSAAASALRASTYPRRTSAGPSADRCRHRAARGRTISRASTPRIVHFGPARPRARHFGPEVISPGSTLRI